MSFVIVGGVPLMPFLGGGMIEGGGVCCISCSALSREGLPLACACVRCYVLGVDLVSVLVLGGTDLTLRVNGDLKKGKKNHCWPPRRTVKLTQKFNYLQTGCRPHISYCFTVNSETRQQ